MYLCFSDVREGADLILQTSHKMNCMRVSFGIIALKVTRSPGKGMKYHSLIQLGNQVSLTSFTIL